MTDVANHSGARATTSPLRKALAAAAVVLVLAVIAFVVRQKLYTYHLATVQQGILYRDGIKSAAQFGATLDTVHPHTVVSLIDSREMANPNKPQLAREESLCAERGIKLVRIPVTLGGWPASEDVRKFLATVEDKQNQPVLVHCAQGVRRTGFMVAAYQESVLGYDPSKAKDAIIAFGHTGKTIDDIKRFVDHYDPKGQTITGDLGGGTE